MFISNHPNNFYSDNCYRLPNCLPFIFYYYKQEINNSLTGNTEMLQLNSLTDRNHFGVVINSCRLFGTGSVRYVATVLISVHVNIETRRRLDQGAPEDTNVCAFRVCYTFLKTSISI